MKSKKLQFGMIGGVHRIAAIMEGKKAFFAIFYALTSFSLSAMPQIGLQTWTCRNLSFEEMTAFAVDHGIDRIQLYRAHVNPRDPLEVNEKKLATLKAHGITPYSIYDAAGRSEKEDRKLFELAKLFNMEFVVVEPRNMNSWPGLIKLAREYNIALALHNHGKGTPYEDPIVVKSLLDTYDSILGVCLDVGWVTSAGFDAKEVFLMYGNRVLDIHFKDKKLKETNAGIQVEDTLPGEGDVNFPGLFEVIQLTNWSGTLAIETDSDIFAKNPMNLVRKSKKFISCNLSTCDSLKPRPPK